MLQADHSLSAASWSVWAKSPDEQGRWLPLWQHMDDSADVAHALFDEWLAPSVAGVLATDFDGDLEQARTAVTFLAGVHDLGKATPAFAVQHEALAQRMREVGLYMPSKAALVDRQLAHHSVAGHHLLMCWLMDQGWTKARARPWGVVLGGHHGVPPDASDEKAARPDEVTDLYGAGCWAEVQHELVERMASRSGARGWLARWRDVPLSAQFQVLATAVVIVSDWIASNSELFSFPDGGRADAEAAPERVGDALRALRLPKPWSPVDPGGDVAALFATRFRLPSGARPRPVQEEACAAAREMREPGLLVIEAPMGEGKTEAALAAAEIFAARHGAGGLMVALPTQATTDAMFARVLAWLDGMGASAQTVSGAITLGHGKARFNRVFQGLVRAGRLAEIGRDECTGRGGHAVAAHAWLTGRKKAQLANFAVVTIDQLLFAGLKSRHLMLRHLGLAGKVVVLDEVHAYDAYMNSYLTKVLTWLGAYRVPVIALSATLPAEQRRALVAAYVLGRDGQAADGPDSLEGDIGYPVLTCVDGESVRTRVTGPSGRSVSVNVDALPGGTDDLDALMAMLRDALADGGTALVVRNTVRRVLATAERLRGVFPGEVTVAHSRFITADRLRKDGELLDAFGAPGRAVRRPHRHIVVASQVVEQSLDVDFDLLVTDLAPVDLVLQRMGRLHRHDRGDGQSERPAKVRVARMYVTGADFAQDPPELEPGAARHVYGAFPLLRAAAVLRERFGRTIELPADIAPLVQHAYGTANIEPEAWRDRVDEAREVWQRRKESREEKATNFQIEAPTSPGRAILGWVSAGVGEADDDASGQGQVRDGAPSLEALLVCRDDSGQWRTPQWLPDGYGGLIIPRDEVPRDALAEVMASCALRLPLEFSNDSAEEELWAATPTAWESSPLIYRQPVLVVDQDGWGRINQRRVRYTAEEGLRVFDRDE